MDDPGDDAHLRAMSDAELGAAALSVHQGWQEPDKAGQILGEIKRRERAFQQAQVAQLLEIAEKQARIVESSARIARMAALATWAAAAAAFLIVIKGL